MAELTFKSAGVSTREIDLSQPTSTGPVGVPAGIIGTANEGPAFVPLTFANYSEFASTFGTSDGEKFGPLAVQQWLANSQAVTYIRVLGAGDGTKRSSSTGNVNKAGFIVGNETIQSDGLFKSNPYAATNNGTGEVEGRTYFLGCFMSESNGSTIFSSAGIQESGENQSAPILRGILLAPSGVILHLSGNDSVSNTPVKGETAKSSNSDVKGRHGDITGSLNLSSQEFVMLMNGYSNSDSGKKTYITASFDMTSPNYFGNVFNTDPLKIEEEGHLLYGRYDVYSSLASVTGSGVITQGEYSKGVNDASKEDIVFLTTGSLSRNTGDSTHVNYESFEDRFTHAYTPWVISQNLGTNKKLFRLHMLSAGENVSNKYKFSVENIRKSNTLTEEFGTFDLVIRDFNDTDETPVVLESFRGLSLDVSSDRYIGRVIGDQHIYFDFDNDSESQKIIVEGVHPVRSRFVRVEIAEDVSNGFIDKTALPFGFRGPNYLNTSGSFLTDCPDPTFTLTEPLARVKEPPIPYRETISQGVGIQKRVDNRLYWGVQWSKKTSSTLPNKVASQDLSLQTYVKHFPTHRLNEVKFSEGDSNNSDLFNYNKFSLENILVRTGSDTYADASQWLSASYVRDGNITANDADKTRAFSVDDLGKAGNIKYAKFTFFAQGGFDGNNIFNADKNKLTNNALHREFKNEGGFNNNTAMSYRKAIDIMSSKADVDIQLLAIPGIRTKEVTDYAIGKVEERFDAMFIMDIEEKDQYNSFITSSIQKPHVGYTVSEFENRALNSSFSAAYFPDVVIQDSATQTLVQVPPSVAVLGAYSLNDKVSHPWYAPAGFSRGALDTVEITSVKLNRTNLDDLYEADINPIAEFPGIGITIWGQKTLQAANSALDRINVRRLLIDVRRKVRNIANSLLFEPNREETLERFSSLVNPILQRVQAQSGVERYKAVIDTSTTTQADVENNTIRGKIYLQPTRSVEFVALDFVVTNAGSNI